MAGETKDKYDLIRAFPFDLQTDVRNVLNVIRRNGLHYAYLEEFRLLGEPLYIPYRIYYDEPGRSEISPLSDEQQIILYTLFTRHHNGYVREKYVTKIITHSAQRIWITPYLVLLIGEYIEDILQVIYDNRSLLNADYFKTFIYENPKFYRTVQSRVVSYWDCYYRGKYPKREAFVGFQVLHYLKGLLN